MPNDAVQIKPQRVERARPRGAEAQRNRKY
jgi:hypothetical protein